MTENPFAPPGSDSAPEAVPAPPAGSTPAATASAQPASAATDPSAYATGADGVMYTNQPTHDATGYTPPPAAPAPRPPVGRLRAATVAWVTIGALVIGGGAGLGGAWVYDQWLAPSPQMHISSGEPVDRADGTVASVAASVMPSVVSIESSVDGMRSSTGSGFVIREDGYLLTNNHVVEGAESITVVMSDGSEYEAELVGATAAYDLAVLQIEATGLTPMVFADSDQVMVGDDTIAVGSPLGLEGTVTTGIVSALHRPVTAGDPSGPAFIDAIQTDAAINPGNSGGPLLNGVGEVMGINSAIAALPGASSATGAGSVGLGFAIPSNQAQRTAQQLIETGVATYPVIGVQLDRRYSGEGVMVVDDGDGVVADGPADRAGIEPGDIITAINDRPITQVDELVVQIRAQAVGDAVTLTVQRSGGEEEITVTLDSSAEVEFETGEVEPDSQD